MKKTPKTDLKISEIREQFQKLEDISKEFSSKIGKLKKDQDEFQKYMRHRNLVH